MEELSNRSALCKIVLRYSSLSEMVVIAFIMSLVGGAERVGMDFYSKICNTQYDHCICRGNRIRCKVEECDRCSKDIKDEVCELLRDPDNAEYLQEKQASGKLNGQSAVLGFAAYPSILATHIEISRNADGTQNVNFNINFKVIREELLALCIGCIVNAVKPCGNIFEELDKYAMENCTTFPEWKKVIDALIAIYLDLPPGGGCPSKLLKHIINVGGVPESWSHPTILTFDDPDTKPARAAEV
jgi:hypothetical protein